MASRIKKYISLKEASIISGYTVKELRNFIKIGLITCRKQKNKIVVPFNAFEKISDNVKTAQTKKSVTKGRKTKQTVKTKAIMKMPNMNLVPFTKPHPVAVKVLESTALVAVAIMSFYVGTMPAVAEKIVYGLEVSNQTVAYMGEMVEELITEGVTTPVAIGQKIAGISTLNPVEAYEIDQMVRVAGISTEAEVVELVESQGLDFSVVGTLEDALIGIADAAETFERTLNQLSDKTGESLIYNFQFENLDNGIQDFFRL